MREGKEGDTYLTINGIRGCRFRTVRHGAGGLPMTVRPSQTIQGRWERAFALSSLSLGFLSEYLVGFMVALAFRVQLDCSVFYAWLLSHTLGGFCLFVLSYFRLFGCSFFSCLRGPARLGLALSVLFGRPSVI